MSPWLFNVYMDGVVREVNVRVLGKGLRLMSANGLRKKGRVFYGQEPPSEESTTTECEVNYQVLAVMY